jgi:hypothetical protein
MSTRLLAVFGSWEQLRAARESLEALGTVTLETYSPMPPPGSDANSPLPCVMLIAGLAGFFGFFALMAWADLTAYPMDIGGRPRFAWPTFVPIAFELAVLCAMAAGFIGWFALCGRPAPYEGIDAAATFARASRDGFALDFTAPDAATLEQARRAVARFAPDSIEEVSA